MLCTWLRHDRVDKAGASKERVFRSRWWASSRLYGKDDEKNVRVKWLPGTDRWYDLLTGRLRPSGLLFLGSGLEPKECGQQSRVPAPPQSRELVREE